MARRLILICMLLFTAAGTALADVSIGEARRLIESGEILPLERVLAILQKQRPGHAIDVELEHEDGRYLYEIEWLDPTGRVWELDVDARNGRLLHKHGDD